MVDALAKPKSDKSLLKIIADDYNVLKIFVKKIKLNREMVSNNSVYEMCVNKLHHKPKINFC